MKHHTTQLGEEEIGKLLLKLSAPAMIGMFVAAFYNLVDTIFIGRSAGSLAIAGMTVAFPIQMIIMAIALSIGIGGSSIISRALGAGDKDKAELAMGNIFTLVTVSSVLLTILGLVFLEPLLKIFGSNPEIHAYAADYIRIILLGSVFFSFAVAANNIVRAEGNAKMAMSVMLVSAVLNIILDPIFIFKFKLGIAGAAWATIISQFISFLYIAYYFISNKSMLRFHWKYVKLKYEIVRETLAIGISTFARQSAMSVMTIIINNTLNFYDGSVAIAAFGIINRLLVFVMMPIFGVIQGMQPIIGFNHGANQKDRVHHSIFLSIKITTIMSTGAFIILMLFARPLAMLFTTDTNLIDLSVRATRIIILLLPFIGFQTVAAGLYQALGKAKASLFLTLLRQVILLIPLVIILPLFFHTDGVWLSFPVSDLFAGFITFFMLRHEMRLLKI